MTADDFDQVYDTPSPENPIARPTRYTVTCLPDGTPDEDMWAINVETRPGGRWAVRLPRPHSRARRTESETSAP